MIQFVLHWLAVHTGTDAPGDRWYNFWSGFGSDLGEITLIGMGYAALRHMNCHSRGCWRIGHHNVANGQYKVCRKCYKVVTGADGAPTKEAILLAHQNTESNS